LKLVRKYAFIRFDLDTCLLQKGGETLNPASKDNATTNNLNPPHNTYNPTMGER
jgi:hypothetical protein